MGEFKLKCAPITKMGSHKNGVKSALDSSFNVDDKIF